MRNIHNESYIACYENGDVKIKGIDGSTNIFVKKGDLEIHVSQIKHESRILVEEGDVILKMIDTHPQSGSNQGNNHHLEAMAKTRLAFNETLWTLPPPSHHHVQESNINEEASEDEVNEEMDEECEEDEEISVT